MKGLSSGARITLTAPSGGVTVDVPARIGNWFGMPHESAAAGASCVLVVEGVHTFPKATGTAWTEGKALFWDQTNKKLTAVKLGPPVATCTAAAASGATTGAAKILPPPGTSDGTLAVMDDDSAASNGTAVKIDVDELGKPYLVSTTANNAQTYVETDDGGVFVVGDSDTPGGVQLYFDEDADAGSKFLCASPTGQDLYLTDSLGRKVRIKHDATPTGEGVAVYIDDNGATKAERLLFVSPTNADGSDYCWAE